MVCILLIIIIIFLLKILKDQIFIPEYKKDWHKWLAWHPIKINNNYKWLSFVERKITGYEIMYGSPFWGYREIKLDIK